MEAPYARNEPDCPPRRCAIFVASAGKFGHAFAMNGETLRELMKAVFKADEIEGLAREYQVVQRERCLDIVMLVTSLVLAGGTHDGGRQYDALRMYTKSGAPKVVRGTFYAWFTAPLERLLVELLRRAIAHGQGVAKLLPGILGSVIDWRIVDSTTVKLDDALVAEWPGAGDYAALKIHKEWSVGNGNLVAYHLSPAREHDAPHLTIDASRRGTGLIADLGYASLRLIIDCEAHDVRYVIRLKNNWKPRVDRIVRGAASSDIAPTDDFQVMVEQDLILQDGNAIDADVTVGRGSETAKSRLVGVPTPNGYCFFLTNLPRHTHGPLQVGTIYRVRWEIEIDNKVDKMGTRLDEIGARTPTSVRILLLASMLNATLARTIVQHEKLAIVKEKRALKLKAAPRAPLHPIQTVRAMTVCFPLLFALLQRKEPTVFEWNQLMSKLRVLGQHANWRRKPSVLDTLQGLTAPPGRPRNAKTKCAASA